MEMLALVFVCVLGVLHAKEPGHLKPGALVGHLGRVALIEDVLWVRYPYESLRSIPDRLKVVVTDLDVILTRLKNEDFSARNATKWDDPLSLLTLFATRLTFVNDSITLALEAYLGLDKHNRAKRGYLDGIGELSRDLFGTAMDSDVMELRAKYNELTYLAASNNRAVMINCKKLAKLDRHVNDLGLYVNRLRLALNKVLATLDSLYDFMVLTQALPALENAVNSLVHTNQEVISNVVDAVHGRVTPTLFPVKDFLHALALGEKEYGLKAVYNVQGIHHYYPLLDSLITTEDIVIHVPFQSNELFEVYEVEPFPFSINNSIMTLNLPPSVVLVSSDFTLFATGSLSDLQRCRTESLHHYHCPASLFAFLPITGGICEVVLTQQNATKALELCPYTELAPKSLYHRTFFSHHYFLFTDPLYISIICPEGTEYQEASGHLAVSFACKIRSANLTTFPSKFHRGFVGNSSARVYPLTALNKLHITSVKYVTKVSEFHFSNTSDLEAAVQDVLPTYLSPYIHFPTYWLPLLLIIIVLIPLCCWVRKALTLYKLLQRGRRVTVREQDTGV